MSFVRTIAGITAVICAVLILIDFLLPTVIANLDSGKLFLVGLVALIIYAMWPRTNE